MNLTAQQIRFFDTFGFLRFPGLFVNDIDRITKSFEQLWEDYGGGHQGQSHDHKSRSALVPFIDKDEYLSGLIDDPRRGSVENDICSIGDYIVIVEEKTK